MCALQISFNSHVCKALLFIYFRQKNKSGEDGIEGTNGYFRRNSCCSAEQKAFKIPFRTLPRKRKHVGIPFHSVPLNKNRSKLSEFPSEPFSGRENNSEFCSVEQKKKQTLGIPFGTIPRKRKLLRVECRGRQIDQSCCESSVKLHFFAEFRSVPSFGIGSSADSECRGIAETVPSLFRGIF